MTFKSVTDEPTLISYIEATLGQSMDEGQRQRYENFKQQYEDPRSGYRFTDDRAIMASALFGDNRRTSVQYVNLGWALIYDTGGNHSFLTDRLVDELQKLKWLGSSTLTDLGRSELQKMQARIVLGLPIDSSEDLEKQLASIMSVAEKK